MQWAAGMKLNKSVFIMSKRLNGWIQKLVPLRNSYILETPLASLPRCMWLRVEVRPKSSNYAESTPNFSKKIKCWRFSSKLSKGSYWTLWDHLQKWPVSHSSANRHHSPHNNKSRTSRLELVDKPTKLKKWKRSARVHSNNLILTMMKSSCYLQRKAK